MLTTKENTYEQPQKPDELGLYIASVALSSGFQRRIFFEGPLSQDGREAFAAVLTRASKLAGQFDTMVEECTALQLHASELGFRGVAH